MANANYNAGLAKALKTKKETPNTIIAWQGMKSAMPLPSIPPGGLSYSLNMDFVDLNTLQSRAGSRVWNLNTVAGSKAVVGAFEYSVSGSITSVGLKATANGKLYTYSTTVIGSDVLVGDLTTSSTLKRVTFAQLLDTVYIADGINAWTWTPGGGLTIIDKVATLGIALTDKTIWVLEHLKRIMFLCSNGILVASLVNDPTNFTGTGSWDGTVGRGDGMENSNMISWYGSVLISKESTVTKKSAMYQLNGTLPSDFSIIPISSDTNVPTGFVGNSASLCGNVVIGLTLGGFMSIDSTPATTAAAAASINVNNESRDIRDWVRRINFSRSDLCTSVYNPISEQYMCACPIDQADYNNIIFVFDTVNSRWGLYDGWNVSTFFKQGGKTFYGSRDGNIIQTGFGYNDQGNGYRKIAETGDIHLDKPDAIKMWKQIDIDIAQNGQYDVNVTSIMDDQEGKGKVIPVSVTGGNSWDVFKYDVDPYDVVPTTKQTLILLQRGKMARFRFHNYNADQPFAIRSLTMRAIIKDAGQMQL